MKRTSLTEPCQSKVYLKATKNSYNSLNRTKNFNPKKMASNADTHKCRKKRGKPCAYCEVKRNSNYNIFEKKYFQF